jgi:hypothetical protein
MFIVSARALSTRFVLEIAWSARAPSLCGVKRFLKFVLSFCGLCLRSQVSHTQQLTGYKAPNAYGAKAIFEDET